MEASRPLVEDGSLTEPGEDGAVPNFWPIGNGKHMPLFFSHKREDRARQDHDSIMSLPRRFSLNANNSLRIEPGPIALVSPRSCGLKRALVPVDVPAGCGKGR
jgi:hypothetical protein